MDVHRTATVVAALLVATGLVAFLLADSRSATALIPALLGLLVGGLAAVASRARRPGRGVVVGYGVLGALGALGSLARVVPALLDGVELPLAFAAQVATVVLGGWLVVAAAQHLRGGAPARA